MEGFSRNIIPTGDGSHTVEIPDLGITYHSTRGAIQESQHVFIKAGLHHAFEQFPEEEIRVLEMGFGTGLNALLTVLEAQEHERKIEYTTIEQYPLSIEDAETLNYTATLGHSEAFKVIHNAAWNEPVSITPEFILNKLLADLINVDLAAPFHVIYYDAFAPEAQPELWTEAIFRKLYDAMAEGGVVTTYCSKGSVRRAMVAAGFTVKKIPGPPGKREMVQAFKRAAFKSE
jgi:tRNA U34 5-methylaminomethyl-2-thiouridine-forming methyltransferase MnmC